MDRIAIYVEGVDEVLFVEHLIFSLLDPSCISVDYFKLFKKWDEQARPSYPSVPHENIKLNIQIVNVGGESSNDRVKNKINDDKDRLLSNNFKVILGLRDIDLIYDNYKKIIMDRKRVAGKTDFKLIERILKEDAAFHTDKIKTFFAVISIDSWFLGFNQVFEKIDGKLTNQHIIQKLGIDLEKLNPETIEHPIGLLGKILGLVGKKYDKSESNIKSILSKMSSEDIKKVAESNKISSFTQFYNEFIKVCEPYLQEL